MSRVQEIVDKFESLKVMIIGDVMIDAYIWGAVDRISPEAPVPVVRITKRDYRLGGAANVALNVQALGAEPYLCAVIGDDEPGERLQQRLDEWGMTADGIHRSAERPTTIKTRVLSGHQHVIRVDEETDERLSEQEESALLQKIEALLPRMDVIIYEDYDKGVVTRSLIEKVEKMATAHQIPIAVDPKKRNFFEYNRVQFFKPNLKELKEGLNVSFDKKDRASVQKYVRELRERLSCDTVMVTLSELGVYIDNGTSTSFIDAHVREISDVSGAGDTVISVAALCLALKLSPEVIATLSNLAGGLVCEHLGVVPVDRKVFVAEAEKLVGLE
jgi:rfaE bifunctional protein kinase chain/domain